MAADNACRARTSAVKGVGGYVRTGLRGLGDLNLNTSATDPNDPCVIAAQRPCMTCPAECPAGSYSITLSPATAQKAATCTCFWPKPANANAPAASPTVTPGASLLPTTAIAPASATATGGFSHWGLLAGLVAVGGVVYFATRKKS
jgi:hypothetical protein